MNADGVAVAGPPLAEITNKSLRWIQKRLPRNCEAEIYMSRGRERGLEMRDGKIESLQESDDQGMGLRVLQNHRAGFASAAGLSPGNLGEILRQALAQLSYVPSDPFRAFPGAEGGLKSSGPDLELADFSFFSQSLEDQMPKLREMEKAALQESPLIKRVIRLGYGESVAETAIANTLGVAAAESGTHCSVGLSVMAEKGEQVQVASGSSSGRFYSELDFSRAAREGARRAATLIDSKKLPTGRRSVLFDPWIAGEFIDVIAGALSAEAVQRGKSLFAGKLGQRVAGPPVTLIDDPLRSRGMASSRFDDEGVPTRRKTLIESGVLKDYFYDTYTANKGGRATNASAGRASYRGTPGPSSSNFFLAPGSLRQDELIAQTKDGVLVFEVMGMHMADPVSGEFSVAISGTSVRDGELGHGVRGAMLSGNILELLRNVDAVADDLTFYGSMAAPTFRVRDLMVA